MTPTEITLKLRDDCILILDAAEAWPNMEGHTWAEKQAAMTELMQDESACEELIARLDEVAMNEAAKGIFSNEFIRGTAKLVQYRIDAGDLSVGPAVNKRKKTNDGKDIAESSDSWDAQIEAAARAITISGQTVLGYKMIQELGNGHPEEIAKMVGDKLGPDYGDIKITMVQLETMDLREKMNYMNHRIWLIEPSLPVYLIKASKKAEA